MNKRTWITLISLLLVFAFAGMAVSAELEGNKRKGKHLYRTTYKACHGEDAVPVSPDSKTQEQWIRVFEKKKWDVFGCEDKWNSLSEEDLKDILSYLHGHAFDSPSPAKCK
jgi:hypothetical protein